MRSYDSPDTGREDPTQDTAAAVAEPAPALQAVSGAPAAVMLGTNGAGDIETAADVLATTGRYTSGDASVDDSEEYNVTVDFTGGEWTAGLAQTAIAAADFISTMIVDDVADISLFGDPVDDIVIDMALLDIDGGGGAVGETALNYVRTDGKLPVSAEITFDAADAEALDAEGLWDDAILHEMLHAVGFGLLWEILGLVETVDDRPLDLRFDGEAANEAFAREFPEQDDGLGAIIETGGRLTAVGLHWDERALDNELMTGTLDREGNFLSVTTIASLEDLGYTVDPSVATAIDEPVIA